MPLFALQKSRTCCKKVFCVYEGTLLITHLRGCTVSCASFGFQGLPSSKSGKRKQSTKKRTPPTILEFSVLECGAWHASWCIFFFDVMQLQCICILLYNKRNLLLLLQNLEVVYELLVLKMDAFSRAPLGVQEQKKGL